VAYAAIRDQQSNVAFLPIPNQNRHVKAGSNPLLTLSISRFFFQPNVIINHCDGFGLIPINGTSVARSPPGNANSTERVCKRLSY